MCGPPVVLVNESSATHARLGENQAHQVHAFNRSHFDMVKFGHRDQDYQIVLGFLLQFAQSATEVVKKRLLEENGN